MSAPFIEESKKSWTSFGKPPTTEQLALGCLQRIALATESMSHNYQQLINERDMYKRWYEAERKKTEHLERSNRALRGARKRH